MKRISIFLISLLILLTAASSTSALSMEVEGSHVDEQVKVSLDEEAFVIFRINHGTPIYAQGSTVYFTPRITGELHIEAISGEETANKTIKIEKETGGSRGGSSGGSSGSSSGYHLPEGTFTKTANTGKEYTVEWRTALGVLEKISQARGFDYKIKETDWGPFVDCIKDKCGKGTAGWMVWVNGDRIDTSADEHKVGEGDSIVWYYSKGMSGTPDTSDHVVRIEVNKDDFYIQSQVHWPSGTVSDNMASTGSSSSKSSDLAANKSTYYLANYSQLFGIQLQPNGSEVHFSPEIAQKFNITSLNLTSGRKNLNLRLSPNALTIPADVYDSFSIELNESASGSIQFRVSRQWLNDRDHSKDEVVLIKHRNGENIELPTAIKNESDDHVYYRSQLNSFSKFAIIVKWDNFPLNVSNESIVDALNWLKTVQNDDGGFANPEENSSISKTSWAVMAIVSAKQDPHNWTKNNNSPIDYLRDNLNQSLGEMGTADYARTILALNVTNENPEEFRGVNLTFQLKSEMKPNGQIGDFIYTTIWGTLALEACGEEVNQSINWLKEQQNEDGGFPWAVGEKSDYDDTSAAIQTLIAGGESRNSETIKRALEYLKTGQNEDGGFRYFGNSSASNAASDAWAIQALVAVGENPAEWKENNSSVVEHLLSLQTEDGLFKYTKYQTSNPGYMTVCGIMSLVGKPQPIEAIKFNESEGIEPIKNNFYETEKPEETETKTEVPAQTLKTTTTDGESSEATEKNLSEKKVGKKEETFKLVSTVNILFICLVLAASVSIAYLWKRNK